MKILIVDTSNGREIFEVNANDKIKKLKEMIANKKGINTNINLHFNGEILEEENLISDYDIEENSNIIYLGNFEAGNYF